jgi:tetratricopeptide (TPR) repeat protein
LKISGTVIIYIWGTVLISLFIGIITPQVAELLKEPHISFLIVILLIMFAFISWDSYQKGYQEKLTSEFELFCKVWELRPEHFGFTVMQPEEKQFDSKRPYFTAYIPREAVPYTAQQASSTIYSESDLVNLLIQGSSILLVGNPTEGKTRTLFEVIRKLQDFTVICLHKNRTPRAEALALLKGKKTLWLLDDLNNFNNDAYDFHKLRKDLDGITGNRCIMAATCRNGSELKNVQLNTRPLQKIYEAFDKILILKPANTQQKKILKNAIAETEKREFPTLGSICMRKHFEFMRDRFDHMKPLEQDCLRSILLLYNAFIIPLTQQRIKAALNDIFERRVGNAETRDCLTMLTINGFTASQKDVDPIAPEAAYLTAPENTYYYSQGRHLSDDMKNLENSLIKHEDAEGLYQLGLSYYYSDNPNSALMVWGKVVTVFKNSQESLIQENVAKALFNKGVLLGNQEDPEEAIECCNDLIQQFENSQELILQDIVSKTFIYKGNTHGRLNQYNEAFSCYNVVLQRFGDRKELVFQESTAEALFNKAVTFTKQEKFVKAIKCFNDIVERFGNSKEPTLQNAVSKAILNKGNVFDQLSQYNEAVACFNEIVERIGDKKELVLQELVAQAFHNISLVLNKLGKSDKVIECFDDLIQRFGNSEESTLQVIAAKAILNKGSVLECLEDSDKAIEYFDDLIRRFGSSQESTLQEWIAKALFNKGHVLWQQGKYDKALKCHNDLIQRFRNSEKLVLQEVVAQALLNKAAALVMQQNESVEEIKCYNDLLEKFGDSEELVLQKVAAQALLNKGSALYQLGEFDKALTCYSEVVHRYDNKEDLVLQTVVANAISSTAALLAIQQEKSINKT